MKEKQAQSKVSRRIRRMKRVRARVIGTSEKPRLAAVRSLKHISAQIINDELGKTLIAVHDREIEKVEAGDRKAKTARAYAVGKLLGERAKKIGISRVVFDRRGRTYHGRLAALADGAREAGLEF